MKKQQKTATSFDLTVNHKGNIELEYPQEVNYVLASGGRNVLQSTILKNKETEPWRDVCIKLEGSYIQSSTCRLDTLLGGKSMQLDTLHLIPNIEQLMTLTEAVDTTFTLSVAIGDEEPESFELPIHLLPFDQWTGSRSAPELLVPFITPNHPYVQAICHAAGEKMLEWTGSSGLSGYQDEDPNAVRLQVSAVYEALRKESINYIVPPASFATMGQRVRMADQIRRDKQGTCLDLSLLMAACLEQIGLNPMIVMMQTHAFVGVWLTEQFHHRSVGYDRERLLKLSADGVGQLVLVESTLICQAKECPFEKAATSASNTLREDADEFLYFLDVKHCRLERILPMPQRMEEGQWIVELQQHQNKPSEHGAAELEHFDIDFDAKDKVAPTRLNVWERKLLDLTMANRLLHIRPGTHCVPLIALDVATMAESMLEGDNYRVSSNPTDKKVDVFRGGAIDTLFHRDTLEPFVQAGMKEHQLYAYLDAEELDTQLKNIARQAKTNLEESGASSLFVTIGLLHWQDDEEAEQTNGWKRRRTKTDHMAPLMLLPVEIVHRQGGTGYSIRATDDSIIFNITIFELLKQRFDIDMSQVLNLAATDGGQNDQAIDNDIAKTIKRAFAALRLALADRQGWNVHEECTLGLYSFLKFVMWNDVHSHAEQLKESPVVKSLIENGLLLKDVPDADARRLDTEKAPRDFALPIDVDSSQLEAIADAGEGKSFLLYGPPGTGKSQTITNMVSNALYQGKRVLFVAQKMAALDVVQNRLERVGLAPFCLELHSNKVTKTHLLSQLDSTLQMASKITSVPGYDKISETLFTRRKELISYMETLHKKQTNGLSLYDCISGYMSLDGEEAALPVTLAQQLDERAFEELGAKLEMLDSVFRLTGHPKQHGLLGLEPYNASQESLSQLWQQLDILKEQLSKSGDLYPVDKQWLERYPEDMPQKYQEVENSFFLLRGFKRNGLLKELRQYDSWLVWEKIPELCANLERGRELQRAISSVEALAHVDWPADKQTLLQNIDRWKNTQQQMRTWCQWSLRRKELADHGLEPVIQWMIEKEATGAATARALRKGAYHQLAMHIIANDEQLSLFNGLLFDETIARYRALASEFQQLTREALKMRLSERVVGLLNPDQPLKIKEELTFLKRNISNHGRGVSIRQLISKLQHILPDLCPCMLMSPLSVAQFISLEEKQQLFDVVIFDEASQIPTSEAVGAIARGKSVVIVGDPRQMPPTSFFQTQTVNEEEAAFDDMDSILDDCIALSMPSHYLTWHYRSRHESLIAFSNTNYYEGRLMTFPSADDRASHVEFVAVEGTYDKGASRSNRQEAEAIVDEVMSHYADAERRKFSLGVISFSKVQQTLIEDLLAERLKGQLEIEKRINEGEEPLFIKNLENVQGDERDVILFSVGYGPDKNGNVSMNFGPLNVSGGERRLNVAVSRARQRMKVFSSMHADQIDLSRTQALGVVGLKNFLYFAEHGQQPEFASQQRGTVQTGGLPQLIAAELRLRGYQVDTYVGRSSFRVDLAVVHPENPDQYVLGILCDGTSYYATPTARDREIVQPSVLKGLGWNIERVWSVDWLEDPIAVIDRLVDKLPDVKMEE